QPPQAPTPAPTPAPNPGPAQSAPAKPGSAWERNSMLAPIQIESLTLTPVIVNKPPSAKEQVDMLVLDEAMAAKKVKIREVSSEDVNSLTLINSADQPVFVLAGEVIIGGKQDRIIGTNIVIPPKSTQDVPVFCVEHGRWDNSSKEFTSARALAHGRLRGKANYENQSEVWSEVATKNAQRKTKTATDTYRKVAVQQSDGTLRNWEKRIGDALGKLPAADRERMVGYVIALNGKVATVDVFQSPTLFRKLEPKLVKSYATEALDVTAAKDAKPPTQQAVYDFMADADKAAEEHAYESRASASKKYKGERAAKAKVQWKPTADAAPPAAAPSVYENYQAK
ncbi:MAG: ARPP-1 family domain-containing protein, partial [Kofleriaceae bacterium]